MTYGAFASEDFESARRGGGTWSALAPALACAVALTASAAVGLTIFYSHSGSAPPTLTQTAFVPPPPPKPIIRPAAPRMSATERQLAAHSYVAMLDSLPTGGYAPVALAQSVRLEAGFVPRRPSANVPAPGPIAAPQIADDSDQAETTVVPALPSASKLVEQDIPMPLRRPAFLEQPVETAAARASRRVASIAPMAVPSAPAPTAPDNSFFDRLFGQSRPQGTALAYAAPEDGGIANLIPGRPTYDHWTAIYDISTHTVYLPDGTRLEAHSGLGASLDDPRSVGQRMRGATPPNVYDLTLREALFHGVQALRLTPVGNGETYGRGGLLAHTFMLGPRGDSNGCVVFRNYQAFLAAYETGAIRRLAVVTRMN